MSWLDSIILGFLQGATEFLPISSSAHLVIGQAVLHIQAPGMALEIVLHMGTLVSILIYYRSDILELVKDIFRAGAAGVNARELARNLIIATIPAVVVALTLEDVVSAAFDSITTVGWMLLVTTVVLFSSKFSSSAGDAKFGWQTALIIGIAQAFAILPGISRSGITIVAGLWLGQSGAKAARFSFLMAIPALIGAGVFALGDVNTTAGSMGTATFVLGFGTSLLVGLAGITLLIRLLGQGRMYLFSAYTFLLALVVIFGA